MMVCRNKNFVLSGQVSSEQALCSELLFKPIIADKEDKQSGTVFLSLTCYFTTVVV